MGQAEISRTGSGKSGIETIVEPCKDRYIYMWKRSILAMYLCKMILVFVALAMELQTIEYSESFRENENPFPPLNRCGNFDQFLDKEEHDLGEEQIRF